MFRDGSGLLSAAFHVLAWHGKEPELSFTSTTYRSPRHIDLVVVYDLSDDKERARVDRVLKGFGFRLQKSVFECRLDRRGARALTRELQHLELKTGQVILYRRQPNFPREVVGLPVSSPDDGIAFII